MKNTKSQHGFTLIEILVVIGLIAILATIVIIAINPARQFAQGRNTQRTANVNAILNAIGQYTADNTGKLPTFTSGADAKVLCGDILGKYIPSIPVDPEVDAGPIKSCSSVYDTGYIVTKDSNSRVTVSAPNAATETALDDAETISVTR